MINPPVNLSSKVFSLFRLITHTPRESNISHIGYRIHLILSDIDLLKDTEPIKIISREIVYLIISQF